MHSSSDVDLTNTFIFELQFLKIGMLVSPTILGRRSLCYLMNEMPKEALSDAMQAQIVAPVWHIASYLQAVALFMLGMENEALTALKEGTAIEAQKILSNIRR